MKLKIVLLLLAVVAVALAVTLLVSRQNAAAQHEQDVTSLAYTSNKWQEVPSGPVLTGVTGDARSSGGDPVGSPEVTVGDAGGIAAPGRGFPGGVIATREHRDDTRRKG